MGILLMNPALRHSGYCNRNCLQLPRIHWANLQTTCNRNQRPKRICTCNPAPSCHSCHLQSVTKDNLHIIFQHQRDTIATCNPPPKIICNSHEQSITDATPHLQPALRSNQPPRSQLRNHQPVPSPSRNILSHLWPPGWPHIHAENHQASSCWS